MATARELQTYVNGVFSKSWKRRVGQKVPEAEDLVLVNDGVELEATVLYADLAESTRMVDNHSDEFAAEVYKAYLYCAATLIRDAGGTITAYDGDRVMAVFIGDSKNTGAAKCGLRINWVVEKVINPAIANQYSNDFAVHQVVGIDTGSLFVAKTGVRGANDLVWVGRPANYAAKLTECNPEFPTWITDRVFVKLANEAKTSGGKTMWTQHRWNAMGGMTIYGSTWNWSIT